MGFIQLAKLLKLLLSVLTVHSSTVMPMHLVFTIFLEFKFTGIGIGGGGELKYDLFNIL
jgi:hypothetical protein